MEDNNDQEHIQNLLLIDFKRKINKHSINYDDIENKFVSDFKAKSKLSENEIMDVLKEFNSILSDICKNDKIKFKRIVREIFGIDLNDKDL